MIEANGTRLLVGAIREVWLPERAMEEDYTINIEQEGTVAISGVDTYHRTNQLKKLPYVRVGEEIKRPGL